MKTPADGWDRDERAALEPFEADLAAVRARHASDPPLDLLRAASADALPPDLQERVSDHLAGSVWSRALLAGAQDAEPPFDAADEDRLLARIARSADRKRPWWSNVRVWAPLAATAATLAIVVAVWSSRRQPASANPGAAPPKPETTIARAEFPRFELPLDKPDVKLSVGALTWRGPSGARSLVDDLAPALDAYRQSDYARAAQALEPLERRYPASIEVPFYRGISLLFMNDPAGAIVELQRAERMNDDAFAADIAWYLAVAEQRAGKPAAARARLEPLCKKAGPRRAAACDAIRKLDAAH